MIYTAIQREVQTIAKDLTEFGEGVVEKPSETSGRLPVGCPVMAAPDILDFVRYTLRKLVALEEYIVKSAALAQKEER